MEQLMIASPVKREQLRDQTKARALMEMRATLPVYTLEEIRFHKLPYSEALLLGLEDKGYESTPAFLKDLFEYQESCRQQAGHDSTVWNRPQLKQSKSKLKILSEALCACEKYHFEGKFEKECEKFLQVAVYFAFSNIDWWWLGVQLLLQSISVSKEYTCLGRKYEALGRYAYSKFLVENAKDYSNAMDNLYIARGLSCGHCWYIKHVFPELKDPLYWLVNYMLYVCLMIEAQSLMKKDYKRAAALAIQARNRAADACSKQGEIEAYFIRGICEMNCRKIKAAIITFHNALRLQKQLGSIEDICRIELALAKAFQLNGDTVSSLKMLLSIKDTAESNNLLFYLGQSYKCLGEFYLNNGEPEKASPLFINAFAVFRECNADRTDTDSLKNLKAISGGMELFPKFLKVLESADGDSKTAWSNLTKMVDWKDSRKPFWLGAGNMKFVFNEVEQGIVCLYDYRWKKLIKDITSEVGSLCYIEGFESELAHKKMGVSYFDQQKNIQSTDGASVYMNTMSFSSTSLQLKQ